MAIGKIRSFECHSNYVDVCKWSPKGDFLITASTDRRTFLWQDQDKTVRKALPVFNNEAVSCVSWADQADQFALGTTLKKAIKKAIVVNLHFYLKERIKARFRCGRLQEI